jgi:hypothetical protein
VAIEESMTGNYETGVCFRPSGLMTYKGGLIAYIYPLLPSIYTQNRDIIDWYITELRKPFRL